MATTQTETKFPLLATAQGEKPQAPAVVAAQPSKEDLDAKEAQDKANEEKEKLDLVAKAKEAIVSDDEDIDDEKLLKALNKKNGTSFKSFEEVKNKMADPVTEPTAEQKVELAKKIQQDSIEWAMGTGKLSKEKYDQSVIDKNKPKREIALMLFTQELQQEDKTITAEDAEELFRDFYAEDAEVDSKRKILGEKSMNKVAEQYLAANYGDVDSLEKDYTAYKTTADRQKAYNTQARTVIDAIPKEVKFKIPYTSADGSVIDMEIPFSIDEKDIAALRKDFTSPYAFSLMGADKGEVKDEAIISEFLSAIKTKRFDEILSTACKSYGEKVETDVMAKLKGFKGPESTINTAQGQVNKNGAPPEYKLLRQTQDKGPK